MSALSSRLSSVGPSGPGRLSGRPQSIATIRTGVEARSLPTRFGHPPTALCDRRKAEIVVISDACPKSPVLFDSPAGLARQTHAGADILTAPQPRELTLT